MISDSEPLLTDHRESFFDPALFVHLFHNGEFRSEADKKSYTWIVEQVHSIFKNGNLRGRRLLDIGTGPVCYPIITASNWFADVYLSDLSKANIEFLQKWRKGESGHMKPTIECFVKLENFRGSWQERDLQLRDKVKDVVECDVNKPNPLSGTVLENVKFEVITSCFCISAAVLTIEDFRKALKNISTVLKPDGHLIVCDSFDVSFYSVGDMRFRTLKTTLEELQRAFEDSGYVIELWKSFSFGFGSVLCDGFSLYFVVARKL